MLLLLLLLLLLLMMMTIFKYRFSITESYFLFNIKNMLLLINFNSKDKQ